ncbi:unnamed protein product, partial [Didymodactylos carnosus]
MVELMTNHMVRVADQHTLSPPQWYSQSTSNPRSINEKEEWTKYSDIESEIIEEAFNKNNQTDLLELDNYWIDLTQSLQISKSDKTQQRQIKRILNNRNGNKCLREERFFLPLPIGKPFNEWSHGGYWFINEWQQKQFKNISNCDKVEQAANGIILEGNQLDKQSDAQWIAQKLRAVKDKDEPEIYKCCIKLYTYDSFLYSLLNKTLRENDQTKIDTLGPFCHYLYYSWYNLGTRTTLKVYRGANLGPDAIEQYKRAVS